MSELEDRLEAMFRARAESVTPPPGDVDQVMRRARRERFNQRIWAPAGVVAAAAVVVGVVWIGLPQTGDGDSASIALDAPVTQDVGESGTLESAEDGGGIDEMAPLEAADDTMPASEDEISMAGDIQDSAMNLDTRRVEVTGADLESAHARVPEADAFLVGVFDVPPDPPALVAETMEGEIVHIPLTVAASSPGEADAGSVVSGGFGLVGSVVPDGAGGFGFVVSDGDTSRVVHVAADASTPDVVVAPGWTMMADRPVDTESGSAFAYVTTMYNSTGVGESTLHVWQPGADPEILGDSGLLDVFQISASGNRILAVGAPTEDDCVGVTLTDSAGGTYPVSDNVFNCDLWPRGAVLFAAGTRVALGVEGGLILVADPVDGRVLHSWDAGEPGAVLEVDESGVALVETVYGLQTLDLADGTFSPADNRLPGTGFPLPVDLNPELDLHIPD